jgi:hypothetical protein
VCKEPVRIPNQNTVINLTQKPSPAFDCFIFSTWRRGPQQRACNSADGRTAFDGNLMTTAVTPKLFISARVLPETEVRLLPYSLRLQSDFTYQTRIVCTFCL